ncbi:MAG TPA: TPM domain-containing protein [Casimicrobiaceae bacterium]|nr:TPM domain-containing protein [Casimicrobiaceae bacterium]
MTISRSESETIDAAIARVEARTGVQIVTAVVGKADTYAELPWMAFALGVSVAGLAVVVLDWARPDWPASHVALLAAVTLLAAGGASGLFAIFVPPYARLFLRSALADLEVRHYAQSLFLRRELFKTRSRNAVLILVCKFERKVEILPDAGLYGRIAAEDWNRVIAAMTPLLRSRRFADALHAGVALAGQILAARGFSGSAGGANELPDGSIEEQGPT